MGEMIDTDMHPTEFVELYNDTLDDVYRYASRLTGGDRIRTDGPTIEPTLP